MRKTLKTILLLFVSLVITFGTISTILICKEDNKIIKYEIVNNNNIDVEITEFWDNGVKYPLKSNNKIKNSDYDDENDSLIIKANSKVSFESAISNNISIALSGCLDCEPINVTKNDKEYRVLNLNYEDNKTFDLNMVSDSKLIINSFKNINVLLILIGFGLIIINYKILLYMYKHFSKDKILTGKDILKLIILFLFLFYIAFCCLYFYFLLFGKKLIFLILFLFLALMYYYRNIIKNNLIILFLLIATPIGILMIFLLPDGNVPDEMSHFLKSYDLSYFYTEKLTWEENGTVYAYMPNSYSEYVGPYVINIFSPQEFTSKKQMFTMYDSSNDHELKIQKYNISNVDSLNDLCYYPSAVILLLCRLIGINCGISFVLGRSINFLIWLLLCFLSLKIVPKFKKTFLSVMLLPICIQQAIGYNQDYLHNALLFLYIALIIKEIFSKSKISNKNLIIILLVGILSSFCKLGYFFISLLTILIPSERFKNRKVEIFSKLILIFSTILLFIFIYFNSNFNIVSNNDSLSFYSLISNPLFAIKLYTRSFIHWFDYMFFRGLIDGYGYSTKYNGSLIATMSIIFNFIMFFANDLKVKMSYKMRIICALIAFFTTGLIFTSMLGANNFDTIYLNGLQARYFIPVVLIVLIGSNNSLFQIRSKNNNLIYGILLTLINIGMIYTISKGFYV